MNCKCEFKYKNKSQKYCCYECSNEYKRNNNFKICVICGEKHKKEKDCCSVECGYKLLSQNHIKRIEEKLNIESLEELLKELYLGELKTTREISYIIYGKYTNNSSITRLLRHYNIEARKGGEAIETQWLNAKERRKTTRDTFIKTRGINPKDKNAFKTQELRKTSEYNEWRLKVYWKYKFVCDCCNSKRSKNIKMNAHHLNSFQLNKEQRYDVNNGVCLCEKCHWKFHGMYGNVNNTKEQYIEFKNTI